MKNNSFAMAMDKIVGQHQAEQEKELRAQKRAVIMGRVRSACVAVFFLGVLTTAFCYRDELGKMIVPKPAAHKTSGLAATVLGSSPQSGQVSSALSAAQQNAATRDSVIDQITK